MAGYSTREKVDALAAKATLLLDDDHANFDGFGIGEPTPTDRYEQIKFGRQRCRETSPWQPGHIVWALLRGGGQPVKVLVDYVDVQYSEHSAEWVNHVIGYVAKKDGTFGTMYRHISRGDITRGYRKARQLGLHPLDNETLSVTADP